MKGYFEHEYIKFKKSHLSNLIALAKVDGDFHQVELELIYKIGHKYKLKEWQIEGMIQNPENPVIHIPTTHQQKMDQLYDLIRLSYADHVLEDIEITFCKKIAFKFGYKPEIIDWLLSIFNANYRPTESEWVEIVELASRKFLA